MSIRTALGASRARLLRQLLAEGLLLSALGGAAGALATGWLSDGLLSLASLNVVGVRIDGRVLSFVALLALGTAILLGLVPAWHASRADLQQALRATSSAVTGGGPRRLVSRILLTSQVAFSVVLLVGAGLLASSLGKLRNVDKGFDEEHLLLVSIFTRLAGVEKAQALPLNDEILQRVTALPGVRGASLSFGEILGGGRVTEVIFVPGGNESIYPHVFTVTPAYFAAVGMTMARGRTLRDNDRQGAPPVAVVNESLARKLFGGADAVGKYFRFDPARSPGQSKENILVVGVVRNARVNNLRNQPGPIVYLPVAQAPRLLGNLQVRTFADPARLGDQVRRAIEEGHPGLAVSSVRTMSTQVDRSLAQQRLLAALATAFGLTALFLVCVGLYGVIAQWAAQRTQEIGVRMALGASGGRVRWMVLRQAFALVLVGVVVGLPAAMVASRVLHTFLFGLTPSDPGTLTAAALLMFAVASLAAYLPARRASHIDPMVALRCE
jgi:predicted permease